MKIGINTCLWQWPFTYKRVDLFRKIKDMGYDAVEMTIEDRSRNNIEIIKENVKYLGLECIICSSFLNGNLLDDNNEIVKKAIKYIKESIDLCEYLDSKILVGPTFGSCINPYFLNTEIKEKAKLRCVENSIYIGEHASSKKIKLAIEPINRYESNFLNTVDEGINLVKKINLSNVGLNLDTYHMNIEEKNIGESIFNAGKYLFHLHTSENDRGTPGTGHVDWESILSSLKRINYNEFLVLECGSPEVKKVAKLGAFWRQYDYTQDELASKGFAFLNSIFK